MKQEGFLLLFRMGCHVQCGFSVFVGYERNDDMKTRREFQLDILFSLFFFLINSFAAHGRFSLLLLPSLESHGLGRLGV